LGRSGERAAVDLLRAKRFQIVETGWRFGRGEIDIVARDGPVLVFVEVKTRRGRAFGSPEEAVTAAKQRQIRKIAQAYLVRRRIRGVRCRFDVVAVETEPGRPPVLRHIPNAF
jgi:putative endonuclease